MKKRPDNPAFFRSALFRPVHADRRPRASAALGVVADTVAFDRILDGRQERIARIAKRPDEIPDQVQVGTGMERLPHDIREIVSPLVAAAEPAHAQRPLVAIDLAARQADVRLAEIVGREHLHRKAHGHLALHLHRKQLVVDHIVVAVVDATAVHPGAKLLEDGLIEGLAFGDIEVRHPVAADIIEVACRKRTGGLYRAVEAAAARTQMRSVQLLVCTDLDFLWEERHISL